MPLSQDDRDEIRLLITQEIREAVKSAVNFALKAPITLAEVRSPTPEGMKEREARKIIIQEIGDSIKKSVEARVREAEAQIVEKTDPARAKMIRELVSEF